METLLPFVAMVMVVLFQVGGMELNKAAMSRGTDKYILILYSSAVSAIILLPCSFIFHRSIRFPVTSSILCRFFLVASLGSAAQLCGYAGIQYSSPTLGTAMLNLVPAFTFILALIFRMEKLELKSRSGQAKSLGTLISILGAFVVTFYKGPAVVSPALKSSHPFLFSPQSNWITGGVLLAAEAFTISGWYILQTMLLRDFPAVFTVMFYISLFNTILSAAYSLVLVKDTSAWELRPGIGLVAIMYSAVVASVFRISLCSWCLLRVGPVYVSMFKPLGIIIAVVIGFIFLGDSLFLGSLIGASIIVSGFYAVMWGKAKEERIISEESIKSEDQKVPFLPNKGEDTRSLV